GERLFRAAEAAVHQLVGAEHDGELVAPALEPQLGRSSRNICAVKVNPGLHATLGRVSARATALRSASDPSIGVSSPRSVRISTPSFVTATVCSNWAESLRSLVTTVQPSLR